MRTASAQMALCLSLWVLSLPVRATEPAPVGSTLKASPVIGTTSDGVEYGIWPSIPKQAAPTLIVLAGDIEGTLGKPYFRQCGNRLAEQGWVCVSLDLPAHGKQVGSGPAGLSGWRTRVERGENIVAHSNARLKQLLDHLVRTGVTDPERIAVCGTSRGGFLALHFAAHEPRVRCVAAFAPVVDLAALSEFRGVEEQPLVKQLSVASSAHQLVDRAVWMVIGDRDERVGTDHSIALARAVSAAAREADRPSRLELHLLSEPRGHTTPAGSAELAADWMQRQLPIATPVVAPAEPASVVKPASVRQLLLVDDHHVLYRAGTRRLFHPATPHPDNPLIGEERPWEMAIGWTSVVHRPERTEAPYQLWYQAYAGGRDDRKTHKCMVCYAESRDGVHFTRPELELHDFNNQREPDPGLHKRTNIVLIGDGGYGDRYANSVLYEPDVVPARRFKMLYTDFGKSDDGREWPGVFAAFSPDGLRWTKSDHNPLLKTAYGGRGLQPPYADESPYSERWDARKGFLRKTWALPLSMSDAIDVMFDPRRGKYVAYGKSWLQGPAGGLAWKHGMARIESDDFLHWTSPEIVATPDDADPPDTEFHTSPVFFHKGCYFCLNQILRARGEAIGAKADAMQIELMISRDGLRWERPFRDQLFIDAASQPFSNGGVFTNATPVVLEDELRFYYGGYNSGAIGGGARLTDPSQQSGVGMATLPLDRFAGLRTEPLSAQSTLKRPLEHTGQITLKPLSLEGVREIEVNATTETEDGELRVELLDAAGLRVRGFGSEDAIPLRGDSLRHKAKWRGRDLTELPAGRYHLRLHLRHAEVFAVELR
ncbi:MAG: prolyl oligopeptidase family serine peptidase [Planctomycetales bacterium]|nr:prolyl oligopeptidase family serine peptidase [Planctomycetales bacterium]